MLGSLIEFVLAVCAEHQRHGVCGLLFLKHLPSTWPLQERADCLFSTRSHFPRKTLTYMYEQEFHASNTLTHCWFDTGPASQTRLNMPGPIRLVEVPGWLLV